MVVRAAGVTFVAPVLSVARGVGVSLRWWGWGDDSIRVLMLGKRNKAEEQVPAPISNTLSSANYVAQPPSTPLPL